jgi:hypothetical protein
MTSIDYGGAAFPCHTNPMPGKLANAPQDMTLHDYFAAAALTGILSAGYHLRSPREAAFDAFEFADAMIEARKEGA